MNSSQNDDFWNEVFRLFPLLRDSKKVFVLDLNDVLNEGDFIDSFGNRPSFTNWRSGEIKNSNH